MKLVKANLATLITTPKVRKKGEFQLLSRSTFQPRKVFFHFIKDYSFLSSILAGVWEWRMKNELQELTKTKDKEPHD